ncbi:carboxymuconolactone decarboxylase family protein [Xanthobacter sp. KR7-65]|uniref:carboxymuconolactone decarboxylase family protein n=1 Tax=Xanthobacter sp. KR7-65 TaxID=3156612 RepID=UPI0032B5E960
MLKRFAEVDPERLTPPEKAIYDMIASGPRGTVPYIFQLLLRSPQLAERTQELGIFCRYETGFPPRLSELAILVVAKHWDSAFEWSVHEHEARKAGVPEAVIAAIAAGRKPDFGDADEALVHGFATAFFAHNDVPDDLFAAAEARFGRKGAVELAGLIGYYSMLAIVLRIYRVPPQGEA